MFFLGNRQHSRRTHSQRTPRDTGPRWQQRDRRLRIEALELRHLLSIGTIVSLSAPPSSVYGDSVQFEASVAPVQPGSGTPTGSVAFMEGNQTLDTEPLAADGTAAFNTAQLPAGWHDLTAVYSGDANFSGNASTVSSIDVAKALLSVTADNMNIVYGEGLPAFTATAVGLVNGDTLASLGGVTFGGDSQTAVNAGSYTIMPSGLDNSNYTITYNNGTLIIETAPLSVTADDQTITYGQALPTFTATAVGLVNGDTLASLGGVTFGGDSQTAVNAGSYTITPGGLNPSNYRISYNDGTLTIDKATLSVTADDANIVYGQALPNFTATAVGLVNGDTLSSLGGVTFGGDSQTAVNAGSYTITPSGLDNSNYVISYNDGTLIIETAPLSVTADDANIVYGQALPSFTATAVGLVNGDTLSSLGGVTFGGDSQTAVNAGTYTITASGLDASNYRIAYNEGTLTIDKAPLSVTADDANIVYGQALPSFTATAVGLVNGDTLSGLGGVTFGGDSQTAVNAGTYTITPGGLDDSNYVISYNDGTLAIGQAPLSVTANSQTMVYGGPLPLLTASYSGFVNGDTSASLTALPTVTTAATISSHVSGSPYAITASGAVDPNYAISYVAGALTVTPAPLTITANNQSKIYGAPDPAFTVSGTGFVLGQTLANLGGNLVCTTNEPAGKCAGGQLQHYSRGADLERLRHHVPARNSDGDCGPELRPGDRHGGLQFHRRLHELERGGPGRPLRHAPFDRRQGVSQSAIYGPYAAPSGVNYAGVFGTLPAGSSHTYLITATDKLGNSSQLSGSFTVPASAGPLISHVAFNFAAGFMSWNETDAASLTGAQLSIDGTALSQSDILGPYAAPSGANFAWAFGRPGPINVWAFGPTDPSGLHSYVITATDKLGNSSRLTGTFNVGPVISAVAFSFAHAFMSWNAADPYGIASTQLSIDGGVVGKSAIFGPYAAPSGQNFAWAFGSLAAGSTHSYVITATNKLGYSTQLSGTFTVPAASGSNGGTKAGPMVSSPMTAVEAALASLTSSTDLTHGDGG